MGNCMCSGYNTSNSKGNQPHLRKIISSSSKHHDDQNSNMIKVVTSNGGIMELYAPITADQVTSEFPGHALFRRPDPAHSHPLRRNDHLHPGHLYYLLPLSSDVSTAFKQTTPYRMSFDAPRLAFQRSDPDYSLPGNGVWKVRLVINPEQLSEILSQDAKTEELIGSVRTVAKCGGASGGGSSWSPSSEDDERSVSSCSFNWKGSFS